MYGSEYFVGVSAEHRAGAGAAAGDEVEVTLELDTAPRVVEPPEDFAAALVDDAKANAFFHGLSNSNKSWFVRSIEGAKTVATRQRRIEKYVGMLRDGRAR